MVVVNLYDFEKVAASKDAPLEELIENIDIGGPDDDPRRGEKLAGCRGGRFPRDYDVDSGRITRRQMAFWRGKPAGNCPLKLGPPLRPMTVVPSANRLSGRAKAMDLRYGENPHQQATLYALRDRAGLRGPSNCMEKSCRTTTWSIWMPPGN